MKRDPSVSPKVAYLFSFLLTFFLTTSCAALPENYPREKTVALTETGSTRLGQQLKPQLAAHQNLSGFYPLVEGSDALIARLASIRAADKSLDVQYYIWHDDVSGRIMLHELAAAADRGVRVRLLLDDLNQSKLDRIVTILDTHPNIEVRMANPLNNRFFRFLDMVRFDQIQRRMHNKALIADNQVGIVGGRNVGDEYFAASDDMNFSDFDVWCAGGIVSEFSKQFDLYWNNELSIPVAVVNKDFKPTPQDLADTRKELNDDYDYAKTSPFGFSLKDSKLATNFKEQKLSWYWAKSRAIFDSPKKLDDDKADKNQPLGQKLEPLIEGATQELMIVSSYYIPGDEGVKQMAENVAKGIKTVVLTNSLASNDVIGAFAGYKDYRKPLIKAGVELYELKPKAEMEGVRKKLGTSGARTGLHGKMYIKDRKVVLIGSMNLDPRSLKYNSEMGVVIESPELAEKMAKDLTAQLPAIAYRLALDENSGQIRWHSIEDGEPQVQKTEPEVSLWVRFAAGALNLLLPENWL